MARELLLPELAESVVEGEIVKWLVPEGGSVAQDQPVVEVMTDKVTVELPSPYAGVLTKHLAAEGDVVQVHQAIATIEEVGAAQPAAASPEAQQNGAPGHGAEERSIVEGGGTPEEDDGDSLSLFKPGDSTGEEPAYRVGAGSRPAPAASAAGTAVAAPPRRPGQDGMGSSTKGPYGRVLAVPAARKLARELGVDIEAVHGSGPHGRVRVDDVRAHAEAPATTQRPASRYTSPVGYEELEERIPVRGLRRVIAQQMVTSHLQSVRTLHVDEADVSRLADMRNRLKPAAERRGVKLSYLPFVMKAVVAALKEYPALNASLDEERNEIVRKRYYNIGMAVAVEDGLVVPVIKDVDRRPVIEIAAEVQRLAEAARAGKLAQDDVRGGTFSITNIGSLGGLFSFPIINVPEAAILGLHSFKKRPVVLPDDTIAARTMVYLSLSFDHRVLDGAVAAMFTSRLIELLETPEELMLDL
ncbi:MAG TPA: dihydrolipoamide acetyltransferase family protein [Trueperaceae bacterium]